MSKELTLAADPRVVVPLFGRSLWTQRQQEESLQRHSEAYKRPA
jgi:hypothetical protein